MQVVLYLKVDEKGSLVQAKSNLSLKPSYIWGMGQVDYSEGI